MSSDVILGFHDISVPLIHFRNSSLEVVIRREYNFWETSVYFDTDIIKGTVRRRNMR